MLFAKLKSSQLNSNNRVNLNKSNTGKSVNSANSKNIQKVFIETNSTNFFEENQTLKNPNSLLTVFLFILGEYSSFSLTEKNEENLSNEFFSRVLLFVLELADYLHISNYLKENYFYCFLIFISKIYSI